MSGEIASDPLAVFSEWFEQANASGTPLPEAMALATVSEGARPSLRMVLLKSFDREGFVFFTNYESRKAREIDSSGVASALFWWPLLERQIRIEGSVEKTSPEDSDVYFATRPRGSQIAAWASPQSQEISADELRRRVLEIEQRFAGAIVPRPPFWGGYRLVPHRMEFWQGRENRLHDRWLFERPEPLAPWTLTRLGP